MHTTGPCRQQKAVVEADPASKDCSRPLWTLTCPLSRSAAGAGAPPSLPGAPELSGQTRVPGASQKLRLGPGLV